MSCSSCCRGVWYSGSGIGSTGPCWDLYILYIYLLHRPHPCESWTPVTNYCVVHTHNDRCTWALVPYSITWSSILLLACQRKWLDESHPQVFGTRKHGKSNRLVYATCTVPTCPSKLAYYAIFKFLATGSWGQHWEGTKTSKRKTELKILWTCFYKWDRVAWPTHQWNVVDCITRIAVHLFLSLYVCCVLYMFVCAPDIYSYFISSHPRLHSTVVYNPTIKCFSPVLMFV